MKKFFLLFIYSVFVSGMQEGLHFPPKITERYIKDFRERDGDVNAFDVSGNTLLHQAVAQEDVMAVNLLLMNGARSTVFNATGVTPFDCALQKRCWLAVAIFLTAGHTASGDLLSYLLSGPLAFRFSELEKIVLSNKLELIQQWLPSIRYDQLSSGIRTEIDRAVFLAFTNERWEILESLLGYNGFTVGLDTYTNLSRVKNCYSSLFGLNLDRIVVFDRNVQNTPVGALPCWVLAALQGVRQKARRIGVEDASAAAMSTVLWDGSPLLHAFLSINDHEALEVLIKASEDETRQSALVEAIAMGYFEAIDILLENGTDINAMANNGKTLFELIIELGNDYLIKSAVIYGAHIKGWEQIVIRSFRYSPLICRILGVEIKLDEDDIDGWNLVKRTACRVIGDSLYRGPDYNFRNCGASPSEGDVIEPAPRLSQFEYYDAYELWEAAVIAARYNTPILVEIMDFLARYAWYTSKTDKIYKENGDNWLNTLANSPQAYKVFSAQVQESMKKACGATGSQGIVSALTDHSII